MSFFGDNLKNVRLTKGWNQKQLARAMKLTQASISQFESGQRLPIPSDIDKFAKVLGIGVQSLIGNDQSDFERNKLIHNIKSLSPETIRKINDIVELIKKAENSH